VRPLAKAVVEATESEPEDSGRVRATRALLRRVYRTLRRLAGDPRLPRPVRWLLVIGLLPIPGPVDEVVLVLAALLLLCYRRQVLEILAGIE